MQFFPILIVILDCEVIFWFWILVVVLLNVRTLHQKICTHISLSLLWI